MCDGSRSVAAATARDDEVSHDRADRDDTTDDLPDMQAVLLVVVFEKKAIAPSTTEAISSVWVLPRRIAVPSADIPVASRTRVVSESLRSRRTLPAS
jgi:hypothetical protein